MDFKFVINVECALQFEDRFLLIKRGSKEDHAAGLLAFPGGKVEFSDGPTEVLEKAILRELKEELGFTENISPILVQNSCFKINEFTQVLNMVFLAKLKNKPIISNLESNEVDSLQWLTSEEILEDPSSPPWLKVSLLKIEEINEKA